MITPLSVTLPWRLREVPNRDMVLADCFQSIKRRSEYFTAKPHSIKNNKTVDLLAIFCRV